nr:hypothetical protein [Tanacetum cinerariifolium]
MTNYSLWEVILNGDSLAPTRVIEGLGQPVAPTTAEQRLARKNELKARGTLLMALPDKHQLKFNIHKDAKTLMEAIEKSLPTEWRTHTLIWRNKTDLEKQSLDDLFNSLKIYEAEVKISSSASTSTQNIAFVSSQTTISTYDPVSVVASVFAASEKIHVFALPNVDTLSNVLIYLFFASQSNSSQLDNDDLKQIDADDLEEMDLKWKMAKLTARARRFLQRTRRNLRANGPTSMGFDMSKVEFYNCYRKGHFARECRSLKDTRRNAKLPILNPNEFDLWKMRIEQYFLMTDYSLRENELKARGTLLLALPNKHQLKFNIHKDAKTFMEEIEKRLQKLIRQLEILGESLSQEDINLKFLRSLPTEWRTHTLIWRNKTDLEEQSLDDLFNSLKIYEAERTGRNIRANGPNSMGFDMSKLWLEFLDKRGTNQLCLMAFTSSSSSSSDNEIESVEARLLVYQQNEFVFEEDIKLLKLEVQLRDNALVVLRQKFDKAKQERDDLKLKLEKFQTSSKNLSQLLASQTNDNTKLGYNTQVFTSSMFDCDKMFTSETDDSLPASLIYDRYHSGDRPSTPIIEDWVSDSEDDSEDEIPPNTPSFVQPITQVKTPRPSVKTLETFIPAANHKTVIPTPKSNGNHRNRNACFVSVLTKSKLVPITVARPVTAAFPKPLGNPQHALKDKGVIDSGCSWHMIGNMSYLSDFEELNGGCVAFGGNPKGGKISRKGKIRTKKLDFDDVYFVKELKFNIFTVSQMCDKKNSVFLLTLNVLFCLLGLSCQMKIKLESILGFGDSLLEQIVTQIRF